MLFLKKIINIHLYIFIFLVNNDFKETNLQNNFNLKMEVNYEIFIKIY